jgi:hypothetical protein
MVPFDSASSAEFEYVSFMASLRISDVDAEHVAACADDAERRPRVVGRSLRFRFSSAPYVCARCTNIALLCDSPRACQAHNRLSFITTAPCALERGGHAATRSCVVRVLHSARPFFQNKGAQYAVL